MPINAAMKMLAVVLESFLSALLITADGLVSLVLHLFGGTLGFVLLPGNKEPFCSDSNDFWGGISAPLCAKAEKKLSQKQVRQFGEEESE